jgi:hypothetical protein
VIFQLVTRGGILDSISSGHAFFTANNFTHTSKKLIRWGSVEYTQGLSAVMARTK